MEIKVFVVNMLQENTWVACGPDGSCVVVDPGFLSPDETQKVLDKDNRKTIIRR